MLQSAAWNDILTWMYSCYISIHFLAINITSARGIFHMQPMASKLILKTSLIQAKRDNFDHLKVDSTIEDEE